MKLNLRFVVRSVILILALLAGLLLGASFLPSVTLQRLVFGWLSSPVGATPAPPIINLPRGAMPIGNVGLQEVAILKNGQRQLRGSGFLLKLPNQEVIGVTTFHSLTDLETIEAISFVLPSTQTVIATADTLYGVPGIVHSASDLSLDYVLLRIVSEVPPAYQLAPDVRGAPQLGERVSLFSGLGNERGERRELSGTVFHVDPQSIWVLMDDWFEGGMMSGSPLVSQHTGQVVGMVIAGMVRGDRFTIGFHPIGSIVEKAAQAKTFPKIKR